MWCLCVSSFLRIYFFLHCTTYILLQYSNYSIQTTQPTPPHPYPTLIKYWGKGWTNKIIQDTRTRSDVIPSPCQIICHTSIDPWTIGSIGNLLAKKDDHWLFFYISKICWVCKTRSSSIQEQGWPVSVKNSQSQSSSFLKWKMEDVFQGFLQNRSGSLDSGYLKHFHPLSTFSRVVSFNFWLQQSATAKIQHSVWTEPWLVTNWNIFLHFIINSKNIFRIFKIFLSEKLKPEIYINRIKTNANTLLSGPICCHPHYPLLSGGPPFCHPTVNRIGGTMATCE